MADWFETNLPPTQQPPSANDWFAKNDPSKTRGVTAGTGKTGPRLKGPVDLTTQPPAFPGMARLGDPGIDPVLHGASDTMRLMGEAASPALYPALLAAPVSTIAGAGIGGLVGAGVEQLGKWVGFPGAGAAAGDVAGAAAGTGTAKGMRAIATKLGPRLRPMLMNAVPYWGKNVINPAWDLLSPPSAQGPPTFTASGDPSYVSWAQRTGGNYEDLLRGGPAWTPPEDTGGWVSGMGVGPEQRPWIPQVFPITGPFKGKGTSTKYGGPTEPNYTVPPIQPEITRWIPPVEPEPTPFPAGKGTGTKYGGPTKPNYTVPPQQIVPPRFEPPVEPEPTPPEPFKVKPGLVRKLGGAPAGSQYGTSSGGGSRVTRIQPIAQPPQEAAPVVTPGQAPTAPGSITIPPVEGRSPRYGEIGSTGGQMQSGMAFTKDGAVAQYLKSKNVSPEMWSKLSLDEKNAHISAAGKAIGKSFKPLGKGGVLGRPAEAGSKDIENMLNQVWEK